MDPKLNGTKTEATRKAEEHKVNMRANEPKIGARRRSARPAGEGYSEAEPSNSKKLEEPVQPKLEVSLTTLATVAAQFDFQGRAVRTAMKDGQAWFVAADVCAVLEIANSRDAISRLDDDERGVSITDTPGGEQEVGVVNESGLYSLIFTSRKPQAKTFRRWVTGEVLPSIRRTGAYLKDSAEGQPGRAHAIQIELPRPGRYIVVALPNRTTHVRQTEPDAMIPELNDLDGQVMACALIATSAFWQMVQQLRSIGHDPKGGFAMDKLEQAILEGAVVARHFLRFSGEGGVREVKPAQPNGGRTH